MFCDQCGKTIEGDSKFCIFCGAAQTAPVTEPKAIRPGRGDVAAPVAATAQAPQAPAMPEPQPVPNPDNTCVACGARLRPGTQFCTACGAKQSEARSINTTEKGTQTMNEQNTQQENNAAIAAEPVPASAPPVAAKPKPGYRIFGICEAIGILATIALMVVCIAVGAAQEWYVYVVEALCAIFGMYNGVRLASGKRTTISKFDIVVLIYSVVDIGYLFYIFLA